MVRNNNPKYSKNKFQNVSSEDSNDEELYKEDVVSEEDNVIEGFQGSMNASLLNQRILLKTILYSLMFYLLANPRSFKYTNQITSSLDKILLHSLIFAIGVFVLEQTL